MQQPTLTLRQVIDQVSQEKGIQPKVLVEATEQAILMAAKRTFGQDRELEARFNEESGWVDLFQYMIVVEEVDDEEREIAMHEAKRYGLEAEDGEELGFQIFFRPEDSKQAEQQDKDYGDLLKMKQARRGFGRIAAQTAKQVIIQRVRDAEREHVFNQFIEMQGELVRGTVRRFERGSNIIVEIESDNRQPIEAILPSREQTPRESYRPGDQIRALLKRVDREARGPQLVLSRNDVGMLVKLFEQEVPEIYEGIVRIVAAAREPGGRSKIAVSSDARHSDVDPVGACVGMKGSRVQAVVQELRGEKIDIVPWDRDPARFVCNAIAPAEVMRVIIDEGNAKMELIVPDSKLSLAIGRRGQNVRLASQLTGWSLDIIDESRFRQIEDEALRTLARIEGLDENTAKSLYKMGFRSLDEVAEAYPEELADIEGIGPDLSATVRERAAVAMEVYRVERLGELTESTEPVDEREKVMLIKGMTGRIASALEQRGYRTVDSIIQQSDLDRLAIETGLTSDEAQSIKTNAAHFVDEEWPNVLVGQREARRRLAQSMEAAAEAKAAAEEAAANEAPSTDTPTAESPDA